MAPKPLPQGVQPLRTTPPATTNAGSRTGLSGGVRAEPAVGPAVGLPAVVPGGVMPNQEGAWYSCLPRVFPAQPAPPCGLRH